MKMIIELNGDPEQIRDAQKAAFMAVAHVVHERSDDKRIAVSARYEDVDLPRSTPSRACATV